jgi:import receptor subunit TOM70
MANSSNAPAPVLSAPGPFPVGIPEPGTSSLWDRLSNWASENKGVVYTIAGVTLVVGAGGAIYYLNSSDSSTDASASGTANKRKKQRERRRAKEREARQAGAECWCAA